MSWTDIAAIVFACTTVNHLGLIRAVIGVFFRKRRTLPIVSCPRCLTFWCVLAYGMSGDGAIAPVGFSSGMTAANPSAVARLLAISLLAAYAATWLELAEGLIDKLYDYIYGKIYATADTADDDKAGA